LAKGSNALLYASKHGYDECVELLLQAGATVDAQTTETGATPLMYAAAVGHYTVCAMLIKKGANVRVRNSRNKTALDWAKEEKQGLVAMKAIIVKVERKSLSRKPPRSLHSN